MRSYFILTSICLYYIIFSYILSVSIFVVRSSFTMRQIILYCFWLCCLCCMCDISFGGKTGKQRARRTATSNSAEASSDVMVARTLDEWLNMSLESLRLAANFINLPIGGARSSLARRLYEYYQIHVAVPPPSTATTSRVEATAINPTETIPIAEPVTTSSLTGDLQDFIRIEMQRFFTTNMATTASSICSAAGSDENSVATATQTTINNGAVSSIAAAPVSAPVSPSFEVAPSLNQSSGGYFVNPTATARGLRLPPIPQAVLDKIKNGEFINFDLLLPSVTPLTLDEYTIKVNSGDSSGEPSISLVPRHHARPKVYDLYTWLAAWNHYLQAMAVYRPHLLIPLLRYQALITKLATQYTFPGWSTYDRLFRLQLVNDPTLSWDRMDDDLFNQYVKGSSLRPNCFSCHNYGHFSTNCPLRPHHSSFPDPSQSSTSNAVDLTVSNNMLPFRAPQQQFQRQPALPSTTRSCSFFNNRGRCNLGAQCSYSHTCRICFGNHPQSECSRRRNFRQ